MRDENELTAAQKSVEAALAGLRPAAPTVGRDALMFRAGQAAGWRQVRRWQAAASMLGVLLVVVLVHPWAGPDPKIVYVNRIVPVAAVASNERGQTPASWSRSEETSRVSSAMAYLVLRDDVLSHGVEAMRSTSGGIVRTNGSRPEPPRAFQPRPTQRRTGGIENLEKLIEIGVGL